MTVQQQFDANWLATAPKGAAELFNAAHAPNVPYTDNGPQALALHEAGALIDVPIVIYGWSPYLVHLMRTNYGTPYVHSLEGLGIDPSGAASTGQDPLWQFPPWDPSKFPARVLPSVWVDSSDDAGTLARLAQLYPVPVPQVPVVTLPNTNPIGFAFGILRDITAPDGSAYKQCPVFNYNGPVGAGVDGEYYKSATGQRYLLQVTQGLMGVTKLWFLLPGAAK